MPVLHLSRAANARLPDDLLRRITRTFPPAGRRTAQEERLDRLGGVFAGRSAVGFGFRFGSDGRSRRGGLIGGWRLRLLELTWHLLDPNSGLRVDPFQCDIVVLK